MKTHKTKIAELIRDCGLSQTAFANKSGVSRVQINRIVNGNVETIQPRTWKKLASALGVAEGELREADGMVGYRKTIESRLGKKSFAGLGLPDLPDQTLDAIFVPPLAVRHGSRLDGCEADELASNVARDSYEEAALESNAVIAERLIVANPRLIVLGCPGAGKTTVLAHTAVKTARGDLFGQNCIPVFVKLPEFAVALEISPSTDFVKWIVARAELFGCNGLGNELFEWLKSKDKTVLFLFDGLDEVPSETHRRRLVDVTLEFVRRYPGNRFCITSRPVGFDKAPWSAAGFEVIRLLEYGDGQIDESIRKWSMVLTHGKSESAQTVEKKLGNAIRENSRVRQIAANPLILTILIFLSVSRGYGLPRRRVDLYAKVAEVFLESWELSKQPKSGFSETLNIDLDTRELSWLISDLALEMQRRGLVLAKRWWIEQRLEQTLSNRIGLDHERTKDAAGRILRFISERTGLLEERALELFAFSHRTLQEYFAAVGAINEADLGGSYALPKLIRPHIFHPDWVEVVRLIASQITPPRAEELVRIILDDPDPSGRLLHRGPLLATRCLLDGTTIANRQIVEQVFSSFDDLGRSKWLGITLEAISVLRQFNQTRYEDHAESATKRIIDEAHQSLESGDYDSLVLAAHSPGGDVEIRGMCGVEDVKKSAVLELVVSAKDVRRRVYVPNFDLLTENQETWHAHAVVIIEDAAIDLEAKRIVIWQMGQQSKLNPRSRVRLKYILRNSQDTELRVAAAHALRRCVSGRGSAKNLLLGLVNSDGDSKVRAASAYALADVAPDDLRIQEALLNCLHDASDEGIQAAAAYALSNAAVKDETVAAALLEFADAANSRRHQIASVRALEPLLRHRSEVHRLFCQWAYGDGARTRPACQVLAEVFAEGDVISWDARLVSRVEDVLRDIGQSESKYGSPCPHALWALEALVDARESRCGLRTESVLSGILAQFSDRLRWAFVFGSVARNEQSDCSDVDVMLVGDVTMRDVSSSVKQAEYSLGRNVNPVIYSQATFVEKLHAGDPFLTEVIRESKIPLRIRTRDITAEELDDELRAVEAERLATS